MNWSVSKKENLSRISLISLSRPGSVKTEKARYLSTCKFTKEDQQPVRPASGAKAGLQSKDDDGLTVTDPPQDIG